MVDQEHQEGCTLKVSDAHHGHVSDDYINSLNDGWGRLLGDGLRRYVEGGA